MHVHPLKMGLIDCLGTSVNNHQLIIIITQGNETLFPVWQKESWQTFEEISGYVSPERVNKCPNCMANIIIIIIIIIIIYGS